MHATVGAQMLRFRRMRGFTLIELVIVVAIIAILATIAYPSFQDAIRKSKRGQVKVDMVELAQRAERFYTANNTYTGFWNTVNSGNDVNSPASGTAAYKIGWSVATNGQTFTLTATPQSPQDKDVRCKTLTLTNTGKKDITGGPTGTAAECW